MTTSRLALLILAAALARGQETAVVERAGILVPQAIGVANLGADQAGARTIALLDAQRQAIESALGVMVKSETEVDKYELVADRITTATPEGFVSTASSSSLKARSRLEQLYRSDPLPGRDRRARDQDRRGVPRRLRSPGASPTGDSCWMSRTAPVSRARPSPRRSPKRSPRGAWTWSSRRNSKP